MTQIPPGWYPDPAPAPAGQPPMLRYWDGRMWTEHVAPTVTQQPAPVPTPAYEATPTYDPAPTYAPAATPAAVEPTGPTTPDGARLAGWWWRVGAYVIDGFAIGAVSQVVSIPATLSLQSDLTDLTERWEVPLENADAWADIEPFFDELFTLLGNNIWSLMLPSLIASLAYFVGMWVWKGATLGQLALGLKVRHPDHDESGISIDRAIVRWAVMTGIATVVATAFIQVSFLAFLAAAGVVTLLSLLNLLWPLWDKRRQALHDKAARTVVVKVR